MIKATCTTLIIIMALAIGCSDDDNPVKSHDPGLVGVWTKTLEVCDGVSQDFDPLTFTANADGTGTMADGLVTLQLTWYTSGTDFTYVTTVEDVPRVHTYIVEGDTVVVTRIEEGGELCQYTFTRS